MSREKTYGVIGCGWLGESIGQDWIKEEKTVIGSTTTKEKIEKLESIGISAHLLDHKQEEKDLKWLNKIDVLLLNIPPSDLKENYAKFMLHIAKNVKRDAKIIFISSTSVYANSNGVVTEEGELEGSRRNSAYLINAEKMMKVFAKDRLTIVRFSGLVGGERHPAKYMQGRNISGGNEAVNLIHLADCIGIVNHIIDNDIWGETINASAPANPTKKEYYTASAKSMEIEAPIFDMEKQDSKIISSEKLIKHYGYNFKYPDPFLFPL